jgi:hypothetical protein
MGNVGNVGNVGASVGLRRLATATIAFAVGVVAAATPAAIAAPAPGESAPPAESFAQMTYLRATARARAADSVDRMATAVTAVPRQVVTDPAGDYPSPHGDIIAAGFGHDASGFVFSMRLVDPTDPAKDPVWRNCCAAVGWAVDANGDGVPDFIALIGPGAPGTVEAVLFGFDSDVACQGTATFTPEVGYTASFSSQCPMHGSTIRLQALAAYGDNPDIPVDTAPDNGWSAPIPFRAPLTGYWMVGGDGALYAFGAAHYHRDRYDDPAAMATNHNGSGYWIVSRRGGVTVRGDAHMFGDGPVLRLGEHIVAIVVEPDEFGYWLVSNQGRVFPYGEALSYGDLSGTRLNQPIVGAAGTASGTGYWLVAADGGVFAFGSARFHGSMGGHHLNAPIVGMAPSGRGYWLVAADGGIFTFGNAEFLGSTGALHLVSPIVTMLHLGTGYLLVAGDGGVFTFGGVAFEGSLGGVRLSAPIVTAAGFVF